MGDPEQQWLAGTGAGQFGEATRLATEDDASVAGGFLAVTVRPWQVMNDGGIVR